MIEILIAGVFAFAVFVGFISLNTLYRWIKTMQS